MVRSVSTFLVPASSALLVAAAAQAQVTVWPRAWEMVAGGQCAFSARVNGTEVQAQWEAMPEDGAGIPRKMAGNVFEPGHVPVPGMLFTVRATPVGMPEDQAGIAKVWVWNKLHDACSIISAYRSGDLFLEAKEGDLQHLDLANGIPTCYPAGPGESLVWAGTRRAPLRAPFTLDLPPIGPGELARRLTWHQFGSVVQADVSGQTAWKVVADVPETTFHLEILSAPAGAAAGDPPPKGGPRRTIHALPVECRGLYALNLPIKPVDLCAADVGMSTASRGKLLLADLGAHAVWMLDEYGKVMHRWGQPGKPGIGMGEDGKPRFHSPRHVLWGFDHRPEAEPVASGFVADGGGNVIYKVSSDGSAEIFAGVPGEKGYRDGPAHQALFDDPRGLFASGLRAGGTCLFVADRGNRVIRKIENGQVTTVIGRPGVAGFLDGGRDVATFQDLRDLTLFSTAENTVKILILDGHAVRCLDWRTQTVTTVIGQVDKPGWRDNTRAGGIDPSVPLTGPCLRNPTAIHAFGRGGYVHIVDQDGRALRFYCHSSGILHTEVGNPPVGTMPAEAGCLAADESKAGPGSFPEGHPSYLPGMLSDGVPLAVAGQAVLGRSRIRGTTFSPDSHLGQWVVLSDGMAHLQAPFRPATEPSVPRTSAARACQGIPFRVEFTLPRQLDGEHPAPALPVATWTQILDGDGTPMAEPVEGKAMQGEALSLDVEFRKAGEKGAAIIQWTTREGCSWSIVHPVGVDRAPVLPLPAAEAAAAGVPALPPPPAV